MLSVKVLILCSIYSHPLLVGLKFNKKVYKFADMGTFKQK
jgi:hypothetical protein